MIIPGRIIIGLPYFDLSIPGASIFDPSCFPHLVLLLGSKKGYRENHANIILKAVLGDSESGQDFVKNYEADSQEGHFGPSVSVIHDFTVHLGGKKTDKIQEAYFVRLAED